MENSQQIGRDSVSQPKWLSSPVNVHKGLLTDVRSYIPEFMRRSFSLAQPGGEHSCANERLDLIVRCPVRDDEDFIPVGVVSKEYTLVQHTAIFDIAVQALKAANIEPDVVKAELRITEYGERMELSIYLPKQYNIDPGDGHEMALRIECLNSVDGSTRFRALMGWFRFVCSNGLIVGVTRSDVRRRHVGSSPLGQVGEVLSRGMDEVDNERKNFTEWREIKIDPRQLAPWVETDLIRAWGFKAAARAYHIVRSGCDAEILGPYKGNTPTNIPLKATKRIPGTRHGCRNLFDLSQILAWLAKERRDVHEQLIWRGKIPALMAPLMN